MNKFVYIVLLSIFVACGTSKKVVASNKKTMPSKKVPAKVVVSSTPKAVENKNNEVAISVKPIGSIEVKKDSTKTKTEILEATSRVKVTSEMVRSYVDKFKDIAMHNMKEHGVPASITLAQAILESGAGTGALCLKANNHFGIKCHKEWSGESVSHDDDAPQECFRKYIDPAQSFTDHSLFLTSRPWYGPLFKLPKNDYKGWAFGLKKSGYATDPKYPNKLIGLIEKYNLNQYDAQVLGINIEQKVQDTEKIATSIVNDSIPNATDNVHTVKQGDTLFSISKKYNITVDTIKVKNNLMDNAISIGQTLIIK